jgi:uncharacterized protein
VVETSEQVDRWEELEQALLELGDRAMVLEELDGFIAGLLVCPEAIPPGEWFACAVGLSKSRPSPFVNLDHANGVLDLVMEYYDGVAATLVRHPERYRPRFPVDDRNGDVIWELWIEGFAAAVDLRSQAWQPFFDAGGEVNRAMTDMIELIEIARSYENPTEKSIRDVKDIDGVNSSASGVIERAIIVLHGHRLGRTAPASAFADGPNPFVSARKVGRNEPCPCGSGRKYKRCCGAN